MKSHPCVFHTFHSYMQKTQTKNFVTKSEKIIDIDRRQAGTLDTLVFCKVPQETPRDTHCLFHDLAL